MSLGDIKRLREMTSLGVNECKKALSESGGDFDKALKILKGKGSLVLGKKSSRSTCQGRIDSYIHFSGNLGVLVEVNCETDFVARAEVFKQFVKDVAMQIAAANPICLSREDVNKEVLDRIENIEEYAKQHCLLEQPFIKDTRISIGDYLREVVSKTGENIVIKRFARFLLEDSNESR